MSNFQKNQNNSNEYKSLFPSNNNNSNNYKSIFQLDNNNNSQNPMKSQNENKISFGFTINENSNIFKNSNENSFPFVNNDNQNNSINNFLSNKYSEPKIEIKKNDNCDFTNTINTSINQNKLITKIPESKNEISNEFDSNNNINEVNKLFNYLAP